MALRWKYAPYGRAQLKRWIAKDERGCWFMIEPWSDGTQWWATCMDPNISPNLIEAGWFDTMKAAKAECRNFSKYGWELETAKADLLPGAGRVK